ncbi:MAG TPA: protoporphyrinogen oxidase [Acidimicrobiia bacterium]|nr:protoporphyrinogen oxidase [Acidimicrobiia bacterium]
MVDLKVAPKVAVVGGGISGLAATHHLAKAGAKVTVVEQSPRLGGKVITEHSDGFLIEGGPDSFVSGKGSVLELAGELGLTSRIISSRPEYKGSYVWWRGRLHPLPEGLLLMAPSRLSPLLRSSLLSSKGKLRVLADLVLPRRSHVGDESLESFVVRRLGREVLERIAEPLIAGIHAAEPDTMSLLASFPRFLDMERDHRSLILAARSAASKPASGNGLSYFASFKDGMGELPAALVEGLNGVDIRTGVAVTRLTADEDNGGYRLVLDDGIELETQAVVLATPARDTAALLSEVIPEAAAAVASIRQVATANVTLAYRVDEIPRLFGSGFVVPSAERRRIMGVSYLSQKWEGRVPDEQFALVRAFVGGQHGQELALGEEDRLVAVVREELAALIGLTADPVLVRTQSWEGGLHQYTLGHIDCVATAESALAAHPGLALAGAAFHGIGLNECVESGRRAAEMVLAAGPALGASRASIRLQSRPGRSN